MFQEFTRIASKAFNSTLWELNIYILQTCYFKGRSTHLGPEGIWGSQSETGKKASFEITFRGHSLVLNCVICWKNTPYVNIFQKCCESNQTEQEIGFWVMYRDPMSDFETLTNECGALINRCDEHITGSPLELHHSMELHPIYRLYWQKKHTSLNFLHFFPLYLHHL